MCVCFRISPRGEGKKNLRLALLAACRLLVNVFTLHYYFSGWVILWAIAQLWFFAGGAFTKKKSPARSARRSPPPARMYLFGAGGEGGPGGVVLQYTWVVIVYTHTQNTTAHNLSDDATHIISPVSVQELVPFLPGLKYIFIFFLFYFCLGCVS